MVNFKAAILFIRILTCFISHRTFGNNICSNNYIEYESNSDRNKKISVEEYLNKIRPYLKDIINNLKKSDARKIQLKIENNVISSIDNDEERVMHCKSNNIEIMVSGEEDKVIKEPFDSIKKDIVVSLSSIMFIYCIINVMKQIWIVVDHI